MPKQKARKTFDVAALKQEANRLMALPESDLRTDEWREGIFALTSAILNVTGNYRGFNFVQWTEEGGFEKWDAEGRPADNTPYLGNQTRRIFY